MDVYTQTKEKTQKLGQTLGAHLVKEGNSKKAKVIALYGELGSGKTTFVQGLAKGLGIPRRILSPTFILMRRYALQGKHFMWFYHIDLYRLDKGADFKDLGITEIFQDSSIIVVVEWAERLDTLLPNDSIKIRFVQQSEIKRHITIEDNPLIGRIDL